MPRYETYNESWVEDSDNKWQRREPVLAIRTFLDWLWDRKNFEGSYPSFSFTSRRGEVVHWRRVE